MRRNRRKLRCHRGVRGDESGAAPASGETTIPQESASQKGATNPTTTHDDAELPLYGFHTRRVEGVQQPRAGHPRRHEWFLGFPERLHRNGILKIAYDDGHLASTLGRAYEYTTDLATDTLRLGAPAHTRSLRLGGFVCPDGPATYTWSRLNNNYILRLTAVEDACAVRQAILEGEWRFID
jgi:hypothetical protein